MSVDEITALLKAAENQRHEKWEMFRQQCFYSVAPHSDKIKEPKDLFKFPWEIKPPKKLSKKTVKKKVIQAEKWLKGSSQ